MNKYFSMTRQLFASRIRIRIHRCQNDTDPTDPDPYDWLGDMTSNLESYNKPLRDIYRYR